ncbi:MAG: adenylosuccinate lyase [Flavobacteriales bacterium]|uniref:adenylosuccinate lyase n=1 Tax=Blattabacterium sp. (Mastotermes darwiniensis) TaxID=39768 RepID=UPI000231DDDA|nr:adenylosuccinate lyase [Blattabacterium sp. (Mastotermes darwiniensis)]AER40526.1 Adenylosuccinate lyase [Blattabacterium sp. (Mastotermes darwiniensis) str. MADAR]MDR1804960.1 adenylosuccinate lyase [Flavobacteriales bacterium]
MKEYKNPLIERYSSKEMLYNFSPKKKFTTWRQLWLSLAEIQKKLGLNIKEEQINDLKKHLYDIDWKRVAFYEKKLRHDVMAHLYAFGEKAIIAKPIIHLGATSAFLVDNTDLILIRDGLEIILNKLINVLFRLRNFTLEYHNLPTLAFTHYQPAQLTTVGKRSSLWIQSLLMDVKELEFRLENIFFRGVKGTVGTAASFKELFDGDLQKVKIMEKELSNKFGFQKVFPVTGQTYDRKVDAQILNLLSNISQTSHKFSNDLRLLQNLKEIEEPFEKEQIGSSAMAYKQNPILSERIASLAKYVISLSNSSAMVAATQWLERTLDDSANRRLVIAQAFLAIDSILMIWNHVLENIVVYPKMIEKNIHQEFPFLITESILVESVKNGADRQKVHDRIRIHSMKTNSKIKLEGKENDFIERILNDETIPINRDKINKMMDPKKFIGFSSDQSLEFIEKEVNPVLDRFHRFIDSNSSSRNIKV